MAITRGVVTLDPTITMPFGGSFEACEGVRLNDSITLPPVALARAELHDLRLLARDRASLSERTLATVIRLGQTADAMAHWGVVFNDICLTAAQLARIKFASETGCWLLPQSINGKGRVTHEYGKLACRQLLNFDGTRHTSGQAHRTMWVQMMPLLDEYDLADRVLDHQCYPKNCCYPRHMLRTSQEANSSSWPGQREASHGQAVIWRRVGGDLLHE